MQRIDENTYIDDTLVTCAEYQLFIDEMREQEKYYQPDHWTSYQFPAGQAREPILGVRHSDAVAFCEWVTSREGKEWKFRLLNQEEANAFPVKPLGKIPLGYWTEKNSEDTKFVWVGSIPENPRNMFLFLIRGLGLEEISNLPLDMDRIFAVVPDPALVLDVDGRDHYREIAKRSLLDEFFERQRRSPFPYPFPSGEIHQGIDELVDHISALSRARSLDTELPPTIFLKERSILEDYYLDIFTIHLRIGGSLALKGYGSSPAFEGIRLVKYRDPS